MHKLPFLSQPHRGACFAYSMCILAFPGCASLPFLQKKSSLDKCPGESCPAQSRPISSASLIQSGTTAVWFPLSWTIEIPENPSADGGTPLSEFQLRDISLMVTHRSDKKRHAVPLTGLSQDGTNHISLTTGRRQQTLYLPTLFSLPEGEYAIEGIAGRFTSESEKKPGESGSSQELLFSIPNIFSDRPNSSITFSAANDKIAALPRVSMVTRIHGNAKGFSHVSEMESKDREFISANIAAQQLGASDDAISRIFAASPEFPKLRIRLASKAESSNQFEAAAARIGMIFDLPCDFQGQYRLIWKRAADDREFFVPLQLPQSPEKGCSNTYKVPVQFFLPKGEWHLLATYYAKSPVRDTFKLPPPSQRTDAFREYFRLREQDDEFYWSGREHDIKRKIGFTVKEGSLDKDVLYYAGRLSLNTSGAESDRSGTLATLWDRRYGVAELKTVFSAREVFNAFSQMPLVHDQVKDQVQSLMRIQSSRPELAEPFSTEIRKRSTEMFAQCLLEREQVDPLITVSGVLAFNITKFNNYIDFEKVDIASDRESVIWIRDCVERKLRSFRFQDKAPVKVTGEIRFQLE